MGNARADRVRVLGVAAAAVATITTVAPAYGHDDHGPDEHAAEQSAPGYAALGLIALAVVSVIVWFQLRRRAMLRAIRHSAQTGRDG